MTVSKPLFVAALSGVLMALAISGAQALPHGFLSPDPAMPAPLPEPDSTPLECHPDADVSRCP
ncbi:hypothetical protein [Cognatishimia sp. F0-27]|uniref:hypothetical protein n=1 Tax=Cognatishimia sp. F0-27 TaxID=2816855 RepID=UPI001D0C7D25|nr:hypothetical protein [Cognatishimia sp. F0-27]MCC1493034.1 hypothetical protein [Cognatishimia sp. F0-27]